MACSNCGAWNSPESKFCVKCGNALAPSDSTINNQVQMNQVNSIQKQNQQPYQQSYQQPIPNSEMEQFTQYQQPFTTSNTPLNYWTYITHILLTPIQYFKNEEEKLNDSKTSFMLSLIITLVMTVSSLIQAVIATVRVASYSWSKGYTYSWKWENLKDMKWIELIGKNFLIYAGIIIAIATVFYIASRIIKKNLNFIKTLSISATSVIPATIGTMILAPIMGIIWSPLGIVFMMAGLIYSFVILYELINNLLHLEGDMKVYFNSICFSVLIGSGGYVYMRLIMSAVLGDLGNIFNLFS